MRTQNPMLAYYDSLRSGLVPVVVTGRYAGGADLVVRVTADRGGYVRGDVLVLRPDHVVSRRTRASNGTVFVRPFDAAAVV